ncbi:MULTISPECIES: hypothetical protein [unclassified Nostoc]|nr:MULTISPECIES: hypothetical protein [unclassified Nostoc]
MELLIAGYLEHGEDLGDWSAFEMLAVLWGLSFSGSGTKPK